jgi:hypothetical protein
LLDDSGDDALHLSILRGDAQEQLRSAGVGPALRRGPALEVSAVSAGARVARTAHVRRLPSEAPSMDKVVARMKPALRLLAVGVVIMAADFGYSMLSGEPFAIGPVRPFWIAAPLVGFGVVKLVLSLVS